MLPSFHATTICAVRHNGHSAIVEAMVRLLLEKVSS